MHQARITETNTELLFKKTQKQTQNKKIFHEMHLKILCASVGHFAKAWVSWLN